MNVTRPDRDLDLPEYQRIEEFRFQIRRFLSFSETAARAADIEPQQHQALLVLKAADRPPTVGHIAARLLLKHHSAVGLVDRLEALGLVARLANPEDARQVLVRLTAKGERVLRDLSLVHRAELEETAPKLIAILRSITRKPRERLPAA
jgi:DNA-binding MarR family transcriptional regulator